MIKYLFFNDQLINLSNWLRVDTVAHSQFCIYTDVSMYYVRIEPGDVARMQAKDEILVLQKFRNQLMEWLIKDDIKPLRQVSEILKIV